VETTAAIAAASFAEEVPHAEASERKRAALSHQAEEDDARDLLELAKARRVLYTDVEQLINVGFLAHQVEVKGVRFSLRSLSPGDLFLLTYRTGKGATTREWKSWAVASAIWMVDGISLLEDPHTVKVVHRVLYNLPMHMINHLFSCLMGLLQRSSLALTRTEAYCYEPYSRAMWRMCGRNLPSLQSVNGIPGSDRMGLNHVQRLWVAYNLAEDSREQLQKDWGAAKLVASATSPKGVQKLNASDERIQKQEAIRRKGVWTRMVSFALYGDEDMPEENKPWVLRVEGQATAVQPVKIASTDAELDEQFRRWVAGERDWHDLVVDTYKDRIKQQFEEAQAQRESAMADAVQEGVSGGETVLVGYTLEQLQEFRKDLAQVRPVARKVFEGSVPATTYKKWVAQEPSPGKLKADANGVYEVEVEAPASLQDQVASRKPVIPTDPIPDGSK